jgi:oxalate decarboxylase/phosphoglucose isomerase-like protein (cupin superfamily)
MQPESSNPTGTAESCFDGCGELIMTPLNGRHGIVNHGSEPLEFVVVEALPPSIVNALPDYSPSVANA